MNILGFDAYTISKDGVVTNTRTGRILKQDLSAHKYPRVTLSQKGVIKRYFVHRLVATHYIPNHNNLPMVNHIDGCKMNNSVDNLEWVSCKENTIHAFKTGLRAGCERHWCAKMSNELVHKLCMEISSGKTRGEILRMPEFQTVTKTQFDDIRRRRSWKSISDIYIW